MASPQSLSFLSLELKIIEATNVKSKSEGNIFVRYYLPRGSNKSRIELNTREIPTKNDPVWNESYSLECFGTGHQVSMDITKLKQESLVFELRWRNIVPILGTSTFGFGGSKLLGRAEIAWKEVIESPNMVLDKWLNIVSSGGGDRVCEGVPEPTKLRVEIRVRVWTEEEILEKRKARMGKENWDECGCNDGHHHHYCTSEDYEISLATATTSEAL